MLGTEKTKTAVVICPGCDEPMKVIERKPVGFINELVDVTYVCEMCHTHIIRTVKPDGKGLL
jgi:C4-type Zn-finger protein